MKLKISLYFKLAFLVLLVAVTPLLTVSYVFYVQEKTHITNLISKNATSLIAELGNIIGNEMGVSVNHIRWLAKSHLLTSEDIPLEKKTEEMKKIFDIFRAFDDITLLSPKGVILTSLKYDFRGDWRHKTWFKDALNGKIGVSPVHIITNPTRYVIVVTAPVLASDGKVTGVIAGRIGIDRIWQITDRINLGKTGFVFVMEATGKIISFPDKAQILNKIQPDDLRASLLANDSGTINYTDKNNVPAICFYSSITWKKNDISADRWVIGIIQDKNEVFAGINKMKSQLKLVMILGIIIIVISAMLLTAHIVKPINALVYASGLVAKGDLSTEVKVHSKDEIGELANAFNTMLVRLRDSYQNLEDRVTQRTNELRESQENIRSIIETATDPFMSMDADGHIIDWNHQAETVLGWKRSEVIGKLLADIIIPAQHREAHEKGFKHFLATGQGDVLGKTVEYPALHRSGHQFLAEITVWAIRSKSGVQFNAFLRDISKRKEAENSLKKMNEELSRKEKDVRQTLEKLQETTRELEQVQNQLIQSEKMASIGQLAAGVAHEINNPVGFINNNLEMLGEYISDYGKILSMVVNLKSAVEQGELEKARLLVGALTKFEREIDLEHIQSDINVLLRQNLDGVERIRKTVLDLRIFARADNDKKESVKIEDIIDNILSIVQNDLKYKVVLKKSYGETSVVECHAQRIGQVFINLLINASQAIQDKGIIEIKTYTEGKYVCVDFSDTGAGIEENNLLKIFDPFFTTKQVGKGTGLGLSISYEIVKKHGGDIKVRSKVAEGTTFTVRLPMG